MLVERSPVWSKSTEEEESETDDIDSLEARQVTVVDAKRNNGTKDEKGKPAEDPMETDIDKDEENKAGDVNIFESKEDKRKWGWRS